MYILAGGSGIPNFGDELIALNWLALIRSRDATTEILLDCKNPAASEAVVGPMSGVRHVSYLRRMSLGRDLGFWGNLKRGYEFIRKGGFDRHPAAAAFGEAVKNAEVFHIFGGGYINERWPSSSFQLGFAAALHELYGTRVATTGLGLMPLSPPGTWGEIGIFNRILSKFEIVDVRDAPSWRAISSAPGTRASNGLDDSFLAPVRGRADDGTRTLHVVVSFGEGNAFKMAEIVSQTATVLRPQFDRALFWRCAPGKDDLALEVFRQACPDIEVAEVGALVQEPLPVGPCDAMVTTRFHPHLLAARLGIPGYYHADSEYYRVKHGSVVSLGSGFLPFTSETPPEGFGDAGTEIVAKDAERVAAKRQVADAIYPPAPAAVPAESHAAGSVG